MATTPRIGLPLPSESQAQKATTVSEALVIVDALHGGVLSRTTTAPPGSPADGDAYIVAAGATGAWAGHDDEIAYWFQSAWNFLGATVASGQRDRKSVV